MKRCFSLLIAVFAISCSNSDDGGGGDSQSGSQSVPEALPAHEIIQRAHLTTAQKTEVKDIMGKMQSIPSSSLFLIKPDETDEDRQKRTEQINKLSPTSKAIYDSIKQDCDLNHPQTTKQDSPMDKAGDVSSSETKSSIAGSSCPVAYTETSNSTTTVIATNASEIKKEYEQTGDPAVYDRYAATFTFSGKIINEYKILSAAVTNQTGFIQMSGNSTSNGVMQAAGHNIKLYVKAQSDLNLVAANRPPMPGKLELESLQRESLKQKYLMYDLQFPSVQMAYQMFSDANGTRYFINGEAFTEAQIRDLLGDSFIDDSETRIQSLAPSFSN